MPVAAEVPTLAFWSFRLSMPSAKFTLSSRLWRVLALAVLPLFVLTLADYRVQQRDALAGIEREARLMLQSAHVEEAAALRQVRQVLNTIANADNMRDLNPAECAGLMRRMMRSYGDIANLGAAYPDGRLFCAARESDREINVSDRGWFQESLNSIGVTHGHFVHGKISGQPVIVFGLALRDDEERLRAALFVSSSVSWFDRLTMNMQLPDGWATLLHTRDGTIVSGYPNPEQWRTRNAPDSLRAQLIEAATKADQPQIIRDLDGVDRQHLFTPLETTNGDLLISIGVPIEQTLAPIERQFWIRLAVLAAITLLVILVARLYLYRLFESWVAQLLETSQRVAGGDFSPRLGDDHLPDELAQVSRGFNQMTNSLAEREAQAQNSRQAIEILNRTMADQLSDLEAAETGLRQLSTVVEQSPVSIAITDLAGHLLYVNTAFTQTSGYSPEEVLGQLPYFMTGDTPEETRRELRNTLHRARIWRGELLTHHKDGRALIQRATVSPIFGPDGQVIRYASINEDITETRRVERELDLHRQHLEQLVEQRTRELAVAKEAAETANRAKSVFLANMSHEIRTPMNAILSLNYLLRQSQLDTDQAQKLSQVAASAEHLLAVINDILDLAKIEAGRLQLQNAGFSPTEVISSVAEMIRPSANAKGLELQIDTGGLPARVLGDAIRLRQILANFASNAVKFTTRGRVRLAGALLENDGESALCRFSVSDTGIGIAAAERPSLFKPFRQIDDSAARHYGGTGLGLAIARHLAELMGGEVGVLTEAGQGSEFWCIVRLPLDHTASPAPEPPGLPPGGCLRGHVLLVEDEPLNRDIGRELLLHLGLTVSTAEHGEAAIQRLEAEHFDLVLMDVQMPVLDGLDATSRIRARPAWQHLPIIGLSANAFTEDQARCLAAGMNDFIGKPVDPGILRDVLGRYLPMTETATPPPAPPVVVTDLAALPQALNQLADLLASGDSEATTCFNRLLPTLRALNPPSLDALVQAITRFDFEQAGICLMHLQQALALVGKAPASDTTPP